MNKIFLHKYTSQQLLIDYKEQNSNYTIEKTGSINQLIKVHIISNEINQHHMPLDLMYWE